MGWKRWAQEETELLREAYCDPKRGKYWLAKELDRTPMSIALKASRLEITSRWIEEEVQYLKDNYATKGPTALAEDLKRDVSALCKKAERLGLVVDTTKKAIERLKGTEYKLLEYKSNGKSLVRHIPCGHEWETDLHQILRLAGCPNCSTRGNRKNTKTFYLIFFPALNVYKVGITNNLDRRLRQFDETPELVDTTVFETAEECISYEKDVLKKLEPHMVDTGLLRSGNTETFFWPESKNIS